MHIDVISSLSDTLPFQYSLHEVETEFVWNEIKNLIQKKVIKQTKNEPGEFVSPIFVRPKTDGGFRLILNSKSLNRSVEYKKFKMGTINTILQLIRPNMFLAKVDIFKMHIIAFLLQNLIKNC